MKKQRFVIGISGASGVIYGIRLIKALLESNSSVMVVLSRGGECVLEHETAYDKTSSFNDFLAGLKIVPKHEDDLLVFSQDQMASAPASGSFVHSGMVVCPCSMKTLSAISTGFADNLLTRSADVCLKERRPLILVPRETPYNKIHLENMQKAHDAGAVILPPSPSFYSFPQSMDDLVDTVVARILDHLGVEHSLVKRWGN